MFQINIVAGGWFGLLNRIDSVELNVVGKNGWTDGSSLPKPLNSPRGVTVMSKFYIIGDLHH